MNFFFICKKVHFTFLFQAYLKSTYLLKNKDIFNVEKLNIKKFALSFGLANPPRLRYLEKHVGLKIKNDLSDNENSDDDNEDDILTGTMFIKKTREIVKSIHNFCLFILNFFF